MVSPPERCSCRYCTHPTAPHGEVDEARWQGTPSPLQASPGTESLFWSCITELSVLSGENPRVVALKPEGTPLLLRLTRPEIGITGSAPLHTPSPFRSTQT